MYAARVTFTCDVCTDEGATEEWMRGNNDVSHAGYLITARKMIWTEVEKLTPTMCELHAFLECMLGF
jgi:hypothetical protein